MKKVFAAIFGIVLCGATALGMAACGTKGTGEGEQTFEIAGDLQRMYGENGYPQAALVAKNSVIKNDAPAVAAMLSYMEGADEYLSEAQPAEIVALLSDKYPDAMTPSFSAKNLNAQVIKNCSVKFTPASEAKGRVQTYLQELIAIDETSAKAVGDGFFYEGTAAAGEISGNYTVYAPDGAPALALANAVHEGNSAFSFHVVSADSIAAQVSFLDEAQNADFCILPVNAAAKKLGAGTSYRLLGTVTNGNLYFIRTNTAQTVLTDAGSLSALVGKKVGVVQLPNVPGLTLRAVLKRANIAYKISELNETPAPDKVNLIPVEAGNVGPGGKCDYYLCPEPAATSRTNAFKAQNS